MLAGLLFVVFMVMLPIYFARMWWARRLDRNPISVAEFVDSIRGTNDEYCLVLRPFGNDGHFFSRDFFRGNVFQKAFVNWWRNDVVIESVIAASVQRALGMQTVAVIDPKDARTARSFTYLAITEQEWQPFVSTLARRAAVVVVLFPPGSSITPAVRWEINLLMAINLIPRLVFVLPPPHDPSHGTIIQQLRTINQLPSPIQQIQEGAYVVYPIGIDHIEFWSPAEDRSLWSVFNVGRFFFEPKVELRNYNQALVDVCRQFSVAVNALPFQQRYTHADEFLV